MRAAVRVTYGGPEVVDTVEVPVPTPGDGEVLVQVRAASINTADIDQLVGRPLIARLFTGLGRPRSHRMGLDVAGIVTSVGHGVTRFSPGDEVWGDLFTVGSGAFAEYVSAREGVFTPKPPGVTFEDAATVPHSALLALQALEGRGPIQSGSKVLINGGGGLVGPWAIQLAKKAGAEVTGVDHTDKLALMKDAGADHVIDYAERDFRRSGERYDVVVDIADTKGLLSFRRSLAPGGAYLLVARGLFGFLQAAVVGLVVSLFSSKRMGVFNWRPSDADGLRRVGEMLQAGAVRPVVDRRIDLGEIAKGLEAVHRGEARGKIVVTMS